MTDLEAARTQGTWEKERATLTSLGEDTIGCILERKHAAKFGVSTEELDERIQKNLSVLKSGIGKLEQSLSDAEESTGRDKSELRRWEEAILQLSKQYDRIEAMARGEETMNLFTQRNSPRNKGGNKAVRFTDPVEATMDEELSNGESLHLQQRIMDEQDAQLDELSETIARQKHIGLLINEELDLHVDLLEETEGRVDSTSRRLRGAGRRLEQVLQSSVRNSRGTTIIAILVVILILVIVIANKI
ncbi:uncharacterized protein SPPG_01235 [Spizellomyces punctatus DAOM BR117]|uniref:t-SNARE coiled-coil homology domain-containing protein n=1 Tax=Spizellomyces punctatus (strain DAOM BR117) TaxID=645134 RepID=A0A0L0HRP5_SPIPD|nr:uncharacterized protein SPPG_01235 [Spizellomyces punctatus DAOM BR117]KND03778.1 hypothetical protein SPPG_01235 [Spizellomyces punctatus DAOM BR117]|eukprot:XP_016611817.1 hypothetical protein SPPG_01235 [Spizellomyces punctatus DAOM BR117]